MIPVGISAINAYCGSAWVSAADVFSARKLDASRLAGLGLVGKGVALPDEDVVSFAATAAKPIVDALDDAERSSIRTVIVATESGVDLSASISVRLHGLLNLPPCRMFEVKQACYGGIAALHIAAALVAAEPESRALVIAADLPVPTRGDYIEVSQGAGAVAVLVTDAPTIVECELGTSGGYGYDLPDFMRPRPDLEVIDTDRSLLAYLDCLQGAFRDHLTRVPATDFVGSFDFLAMHTPFPGMVRGAHRSMMRRLASPDIDIASDFDRRVAPSLELPTLAGNIYSATTLLAVLSVLIHSPARGSLNLGVFSYGSGCSAEFLRCRVPADAAEHVAVDAMKRDLEDRRRLEVVEYDDFCHRNARGGPGTEHFDPGPHGLPSEPLSRPRASLTRITNYRREYTWINT